MRPVGRASSADNRLMPAERYFGNAVDNLLALAAGKPMTKLVG